MNINGAQIHLLLNHFPVVGYPLLALTLIWGLWRPQSGVFLYGIYLSLLIWATTLASYFTGEGAEDVLRDLPDFNIHTIHDHEDTAFAAMILGTFVAFIAVILLPPVRDRLKFIRISSAEKYLKLALLVGALVLSGMLAVAAHQGGLIRHSEIRTH